MTEHIEDNTMTPAELKEWWAKEDAMTAQEDAEIAEITATHNKKMAESDARWNALMEQTPKMSTGVKILLAIKAVVFFWAVGGLISGDKK